MFAEQFKPIKGYEGLYEISNFGRVKSLARSFISWRGSLYKKKERILKNIIGNRGYYRLSLSKNSNCKTFRVAHLVWDHFGNGKRNKHKLQIDHADDNKLNNYIDNLQLLTQRGNTSKYYQQNGTSYPTGVTWNKGNRKYQAKIYINGKLIHLGYFNNIKDTSNAYQKKLNELNEYKGSSIPHILNE